MGYPELCYLEQGSIVNEQLSVDRSHQNAWDKLRGKYHHIM